MSSVCEKFYSKQTNKKYIRVCINCTTRGCQALFSVKYSASQGVLYGFLQICAKRYITNIFKNLFTKTLHCCKKTTLNFDVRFSFPRISVKIIDFLKYLAIFGRHLLIFPIITVFGGIWTVVIIDLFVFL